MANLKFCILKFCTTVYKINPFHFNIFKHTIKEMREEMKEIWLPTSQWPQKLADSKDTRFSRRGRVSVWRGGQNNNGTSTTPGGSYLIPGR